MKKLLNEIFIKRIFGCVVFALLIPIFIIKILVKGDLNIYVDEKGALNVCGPDK